MAGLLVLAALHSHCAAALAAVCECPTTRTAKLEGGQTVSLETRHMECVDNDQEFRAVMKSRACLWCSGPKTIRKASGFPTLYSAHKAAQCYLLIGWKLTRDSWQLSWAEFWQCNARYCCVRLSRTTAREILHPR